MSWRREKYIPNGGPFGGDGGNGGDIILKATSNENTLIRFRHAKVIKAESGEKGATKEMHGASGNDEIVLVPVGTIVTDAESGERIVDLDRDGSEFVLAKGGKGGFGNAHFTSSTRQAPSFAELGDEGEKKLVKLELKLVADVGIIGLPNAGKSTLIAAVTSVRPKIADYPFTTLIPNLGVMEHRGRGITLEDVPGLIPGASEGKGLGIQFLKHIERTSILCHLLDISKEPEEVLENYNAIRKELEAFSEDLAKKEEILIFSKIDLIAPDEQADVLKKLKKLFGKRETMAISAGAFIGIDTFKDLLLQKVPEKREMEEEEESPEPEIRIYDLKNQTKPRSYKIFRIDEETFEVKGERIEELARMTNMQNREAVARMYDILEKERVLTKIESMLSNDDINEAYFEGSDASIPNPKVVIAERVFPLSNIHFMRRRGK